MAEEKDIVAAISQLTAVVNSLVTAVESLYEMHPNPRDLFLDLHQRGEKDGARDLGMPVSDDFVEVGGKLRLGLLLMLRDRLHGFESQRQG